MSGESSAGVLQPAGGALQGSTAVPGNHSAVYSGYLEKLVTYHTDTGIDPLV